MRRPNNRKKTPATVGCPVPALRKVQRRRKPKVEVVDIGETPVVSGPVPDGMPAEIRTMGQRWSVVYSPNLLSRDQYGQADPVRHRILIDSGQSRESMKETLLHECLHVVIRNTHLGYELDFDSEERLVRALAPQLLDLLRGNDPWWQED